MPRDIDSWLAQFDAGAITYMELFEKIALHLASSRDDIAPVLTILRGHANPHLQFLAQTLAESLRNGGERASPFSATTHQATAPTDAKK